MKAAGLKTWHSLIYPVTGYFRARRGRFMLKHFPCITSMKICDLGGSRHFWDNLGLDVLKKNVTIYNISTDETSAIKGGADQIKLHIYDGYNVPVKDQHFDLLICNSVLEHVPAGNRRVFAREMVRISKNIMCQTPAFVFPVEPHFIMPFIHWLPKRISYYLVFISPWKILSRPSLNTIREYFFGTNLLKEKELCELFPESSIEYEYFCGLKKSYLVIRKG